TVDCARKLGPFRLTDRDAELLGDEFRRRRPESTPAALRRVRSREQPRHLVLLREALEHVGTQRRGRRDADQHECLALRRGCASGERKASDARTQGASIEGSIDATEDAAARRLAAAGSPEGGAA